MTQDDDKAAVLAVLEAETDAYTRRDFEALPTFWVQSEYARRMYAYASQGIVIDEGWDAIWARIKRSMESMPTSLESATHITRERMNIVVNGDCAWATYDQVGVKSDVNFDMPGTQHELKIFRRVEGNWKLECVCLMQRAVDSEECPLIEVGPDKAVLWTNAKAQQLIGEHPALTITGGKLRARKRSCDSGLQDAVNWGYRENLIFHPSTRLDRISRVVLLGEDDDAAPAFCWVVLEDGKVLVSFNDNILVERRIAMAQSIYGLSAAQTRLAQLIAHGLELSEAANRLGISTNTVRTHLQRMFDRTGTHSQSALVGLLLSSDVPTSK
jgi:DNA-binding CsgD family transcriptional regulator